MLIRPSTLESDTPLLRLDCVIEGPEAVDSLEPELARSPGPIAPFCERFLVTCFSWQNWSSTADRNA